jgi:hypothetical protein
VTALVQAVYMGNIKKHVCLLMTVINQDFYTFGQIKRISLKIRGSRPKKKNKQ